MRFSGSPPVDAVISNPHTALNNHCLIYHRVQSDIKLSVGEQRVKEPLLQKNPTPADLKKATWARVKYKLLLKCSCKTIMYAFIIALIYVENTMHSGWFPVKPNMYVFNKTWKNHIQLINNFLECKFWNILLGGNCNIYSVNVPFIP